MTRRRRESSRRARAGNAGGDCAEKSDERAISLTAMAFVALFALAWRCGTLIAEDLSLYGRVFGHDDSRCNIYSTHIPIQAFGRGSVSDENVEDSDIPSDPIAPAYMQADIYMPSTNGAGDGSRFPTVVSFTTQPKSTNLRWPWGAFIGHYKRTSLVSKYASLGHELAAQGIVLIVIELRDNHTVACSHQQLSDIVYDARGWLSDQPWCDKMRVASLSLGPGDTTCNEIWSMMNPEPQQSGDSDYDRLPILRASVHFMAPFDIFDEYFVPGGDPVSQSLDSSWTSMIERETNLPLWVYFNKEDLDSFSSPTFEPLTAGQAGIYREDYSDSKIGAIYPSIVANLEQFQNKIPTLSIASWHIGSTAKGASRRHLARFTSEGHLKKSAENEGLEVDSKPNHELVLGAWGGTSNPLIVQSNRMIQKDVISFLVRELTRPEKDVRNFNRTSRIQFFEGSSPSSSTSLTWEESNWPFEASMMRQSLSAKDGSTAVDKALSSRFVGMGLSNDDVQTMLSRKILKLEPHLKSGTLHVDASVVPALSSRSQIDVTKIPSRTKLYIPGSTHSDSFLASDYGLHFTSSPLAIDGPNAFIRILGTPQLRLQITTSTSAPLDTTIVAHLRLQNQTSLLSRGRVRISCSKIGVGQGPYQDVPASPWRSFAKHDEVPRLPGKMSVAMIPMEPIASVLHSGDVLELSIWLQASRASDVKLHIWVGGIGGSSLTIPVV